MSEEGAKKKKTLFQDGGDESTSSNDKESDDGIGIQINKKWATAYESRKRKQELAQYGATMEDDSGNSSESDSDSSDEEELATQAMDIAVLKTIQALRTKDQRIYDKDVHFFPHQDDDGSDYEKDATTTKKHKPKKFKDVMREQILKQMDDEEENKLDGDDHDENIEDSKISKFQYDEEQKGLRSAFLESTNVDDDDEDFMVVKKTETSQENEDKEAELEQEIANLQKLKNSDLKDPRGEVEDGEQFLLEFIKKKKWIDKDRASNETTQKGHNGEDDDNDEDEAMDSEEEEKMDAFESKYNFRFEEAAESGAVLSVVGYSRNGLTDAVRRKDDTRKQKRQARKERKAAERKAKEEQLRRLKNAKREEMEAKLQKIKGVIGTKTEEVDEEAMLKLLEGDFDAKKFEELMSRAYGDDYYEKEDTEWKTDGDVRNFLQNDEEGAELVGQEGGGLYDMYDDGEAYGQEDEAYPPDGTEAYAPDGSSEWTEEYEEDNVQEHAEEPEEETEMNKKLKAKMMDELYKLDYEDMIAGMPTRFKYRHVEPDDYGLSTEEILFARDTTLKQFVSLKKMAPYAEEKNYNPGFKKRKRFREVLKEELEEQNVSESASKETEKELETEEKAKKKRRRQKKSRKKDSDEKEPLDNNALVKEQAEDQEQKERVDDKTEIVGTKHTDKTAKKKKREKTSPDKTSKRAEKSKKKKKKKPKVDGVSASRLASYGL